MTGEEPSRPAAVAVVVALRSLSSDDRLDAARAARAKHPDLVDALYVWAEPRLSGGVHVEKEDYFLCTDIEKAFEGAERGRVRFLNARLRAIEGDSTQNVLDLVIGSIGFDPDSAAAHEMLFDALRNNDYLVVEDAVDKMPVLPPAAARLFEHIVKRGSDRETEQPHSLSLLPAAGASAADAAALEAAGKLAEAVAARRGALGEDFTTARNAVCGD